MTHRTGWENANEHTPGFRCCTGPQDAPNTVQPEVSSGRLRPIESLDKIDGQFSGNRIFGLPQAQHAKEIRQVVLAFRLIAFRFRNLVDSRLAEGSERSRHLG